MPAIKVMIVDDHEVVRLGLRGVFESEREFSVVAEAENADAAFRQARALRPDVILMDVRMPGTDGIAACRQLRQELPETRVLMLTSHGDEQAVMASIMAGASGYLLKNTGRVGILNAVRSAASGQSLLDPAVTSKVLERLRTLSETSVDREVALLSERERELMPLVARGLTNKEIAAQLVISENTARNHLSRILEKLGLSSRSEAATFAATHGMLDQDAGPTSPPKRP